MYLDALRRAFVEAVVDPTIGPATQLTVNGVHSLVSAETLDV
jgi:hypothetical protein